MMISTAFGLVQTLLTFITMIALLLGVSPVLALLALASPIPAFIADTRYGWRGYNIARWGSRLLRRMNYMVSLVTTDSYAKEVKLFGLSGYFIQRYRLIAEASGSQRSQVARRYMTGFAWGISDDRHLPYLPVCGAPGDRGQANPRRPNALHGCGAVGSTSIQGILGGFSGMYEHNLYLNNLFELMAIKSSMPIPSAPVKVPQPMLGEITFENVSFAYPGADKNALNEVSSPSRRERHWPWSVEMVPGRRRFSS